MILRTWPIFHPWTWWQLSYALILDEAIAIDKKNFSSLLAIADVRIESKGSHVSVEAKENYLLVHTDSFW